MSKAIKRISNYEKQFDLSVKQTLYLVYKYHEIPYSISAKELIELMTLKILNEEGDFIENLDTITKLTSKDLVVIEPIFESKMSKDVFLHLNKHLCYKNPFDKLPIAIDPAKIKTHAEAKLKDYKRSTLKKLKKNKEFYRVYMVFLSLMPTSADEDNTKWISFFKVIYRGVNLRKRVTTNITTFLNIVKKKDSGIFMYAVYLFVSSGIKGDQTYIGSQKTFLTEWEDWYMAAETAIENATSVDGLFRGRRKGAKHKGGVAL